MDNRFFSQPILNSPYAYPVRYWELDGEGQPTQQIIETRRPARFITPIPQPRKRKGKAIQQDLFAVHELTSQAQQYDPTSIINELRQHVDTWRKLPNSNDWQVTPETARLLQHWRHHPFSSIRPFFCQVEAVETAIWLSEVAPKSGKIGNRFLEHLANANSDANPELSRLALKLATGAGKTTVMAMLIAWQTINAVRRPTSKKFTLGLKNILAINDEAHHCYREKPRDEETEALKGDDRKEAEKNNEAARLWISGLEIVGRKLGLNRVYDLSATPFFLSGSGYAEGTLFPWTMCDFSLMDAIECGIVKLPRVPVADNIPGAEVPMFRELWKHIGKDMPKKGRGKGEVLDPLKLPTRLQTALESLYGHYEKTFELWDKEHIKVPPCFIVVCNNTSTSKLVYDYISGFEMPPREDGTIPPPFLGKFPLFSNYDEHGNQIARPRTLLIDSEQLESGDALDDNFRKMAATEIDRFRREIMERTGDRRQAENLTDQDLLREVMNTVGKEGRLGDSTRCVVSVAMLTEGWDANTVTHVLGVRAFGTQLLLYTKWRDPGEEAKLHLFGQLKRITKEWLDTCLVCKGGTYPAQLMYQELADMACNKITAGITLAESEKMRPIIAVLDPYNPVGSTNHVNFNTSKRDRWLTDSRRCHINWVILDSGWEAEFCRVAEAHQKVKAYVKNHNLGLEVPYRYGSETRKYLPDFIVIVDDGRGQDDPLHLIVEIKGYRREDAKEKRTTMDTYWVPGVNYLGRYGRWAFAEFTEVYRIETDFEARVQAEFDRMLSRFA